MMNQKRIFIGSFIQHPDLFDLFEQTKDFFCDKGKFKWTKRPENLHLTFHFLGYVPIEQIERLEQILANILGGQIQVNLHITGLDYFERKNKPTVLYARIKDENEQLKAIYLQIQQRLFKHGFISQVDTHFVPHITLARIKKVEPDFKKTIQDFNRNCIDIQIDKIKLEIIESVLLPDGAEYRPLKK